MARWAGQRHTMYHGMCPMYQGRPGNAGCPPSLDERLGLRPEDRTTPEVGGSRSEVGVRPPAWTSSLELVHRLGRFVGRLRAGPGGLELGTSGTRRTNLAGAGGSADRVSGVLSSATGKRRFATLALWCRLPANRGQTLLAVPLQRIVPALPADLQGRNGRRANFHNKALGFLGHVHGEELPGTRVCVNSLSSSNLVVGAPYSCNIRS